MTTLKNFVPLVAAAFLLSLGLAGCGEETSPEQQSEAPAAQESGDAAATSESETESESSTSQ